VTSVFLTGATGTIGSAIVPRLLRAPSTSVSVLIRSRDDADLRTRFVGMLDYWGYAPDDPDAARIRPVRGDITMPGFGLSPQDFAMLEETTHIIHCAASVKLNMSPADAHATAVVPIRTVLELGHRSARTGTLRKIDLVSTVGVWGRTPGDMPERRLPEVREFHNTYEAAKAEAERVVWAEGDGLPITVHRPSMVVGERETGRVLHFQVFYHLCEFLAGVRTFGLMPDLGVTRLDTVPVDWVADAICWSSQRADTAGRILHLCSGPSAAIPLPDLQDRVRRLWSRRGRRLPALRPIDRRALERLAGVLGVFVGSKGRRALRGLPAVLAYLAESQGFSNRDSSQVFAVAGLPIPAIESYLEPVLGFYLDARARG
jgi:thioester reductase-like protein